MTVAARYDIGLLAYSPLAGGILTGKYSRDSKEPDDSRMTDAAWGNWAAAFQTENMWDVLDLLDTIAIAKACSIAQVAVAWILHQPTISSVVIGPRTIEQFTDYMGALEVQLNADDLRQIDKVAPPGK
jgi:aryl-alcohol dehydrogenase-like predicted oxidoreductase